MSVLAASRTALVSAMVMLAFGACTGEAHIVPGPSSGGAGSGGTHGPDSGSSAGGDPFGDGGRASGSGGGGVAAGGASGAASGGAGASGAGGASSGGLPNAGGSAGGPPRPDGGPPNCGTQVSSGNSQCDSCARSTCPTDLGTCEADPECLCQASCVLRCPTLTGRLQEQTSCAAACPPGTIGTKLATLLKCLAPPGVMPPTCAPCFHPPPP